MAGTVNLGPLALRELVAPATPGTATRLLYFKSDGVLYTKSPGGTETAVGSGTYEPVVSAGTATQYYRGDKTWQTLDLSALASWPKMAVRVSIGANLSQLSGVGLVYDGVTLAAGDRVLVRGQTINPFQNGIYIVQSGAWTRATDANTAALIANSVVTAAEGTTFGGTVWMTTFRTTDTLGTTDMRWYRVGTATAVQTNAPLAPNTGDIWWDTDETTQQAMVNAVLQATNTTPGLKVRTQNPASGQTGDLSQWARGEDDTVLARIAPDGGMDSPWTGTTTDHGNTQPTNPTTGLRLFTRHRARRLPAFVGPTGQDSRLQPHIVTNNASWMKSVNNSTAPTLEALAVTHLNNATVTPTAVAVASTSFFTSMVRMRYATPATAGGGSGVRSTTAQWFPSTTANMGGFHFICRFGLNTGATGTRGFVGLSSQVAAYAPGTNPSAQLTQVGFYWDATHTTLHFIANGTVAGAGVDLGANFPITTAATYFYEVALYCPSGMGQNIYWAATRVNDGQFASGVVGSAGLTGSTTIPANGTLLAAHAYYGNGTLAAAHSMDVQSLYIESDN